MHMISPYKKVLYKVIINENEDRIEVWWKFENNLFTSFFGLHAVTAILSLSGFQIQGEATHAVLDAVWSGQDQSAEQKEPRFAVWVWSVEGFN